MATGYTNCIKDGISFQKFALKCARNFGALIQMRDDPIDAPIPDEFKPDNYEHNRMCQSIKELQRIEKMTIDECVEVAKKEHDTEKEHAKRRIAEIKELKSKYEEMLKQVKAWIPPTKDHEGMKRFMVEQIQSSIDFDCDLSYYEDRKHIKCVSGKEWKKAHIEMLKRSIENSEKSQLEENEKASKRSEWITALKKSLEM